MERESPPPSSPIKGIVSVIVGLLLAVLGYNQLAPGNTAQQPAPNNPPAVKTEVVAPTTPSDTPRESPSAKALAASSTRHNLDIDERHHGHTLAKHVGKTDAELLERLKREPDISSASTWTDRDTAERCIGEALAANAAKIQTWLKRGGVDKLAFVSTCNSEKPIGRSIHHGKTTAEPCHKANIVLAIDRKSGDYFVLTAYPEAR